MAVLFAFLHHIIAFTIVTSVLYEFLLLRERLTADIARKILSADRVYGIAAGLMIVIGTLRVMYFEKGTAYYFHSAPFIAKISLFVIIGFLSAHPTKEFISWRSSIRENRAPEVTDKTLKKLKMIIHIELVCFVLIALCAAMMAKGIGYTG